MAQVQNIYCVGRNYSLHAKELNNQVPTSPMLFMKPTHALVEAKGQEIFLPNGQGTIHYETELVICIGKPYEKGIKIDDLVEKMAIGLDLTLRDVQNSLKTKGYPWLLAKGFINSAIISGFRPFLGVEKCKETNFALIKNGEQVQLGNIKNMIFDLQSIVDFTAEHFGLSEGDIIFTGTPEGVGPVSDGDRMSLVLGGQILGECILKLR
ncbi:MAG: fumarylacetoacetate hydrolase family protein [Peptococcales bacterium]|jgi:fumarylpyruvate hydrolase